MADLWESELKRNMGEWEEVSISYRDIDGHYCACCGKHVPRYMYVADIDGARKRFCGPDCADVYQWYWLPHYGAQEKAAADARQAIVG